MSQLNSYRPLSRLSTRTSLWRKAWLHKNPIYASARIPRPEAPTPEFISHNGFHQNYYEKIPAIRKAETDAIGSMLVPKNHDFIAEDLIIRYIPSEGNNPAAGHISLVQEKDSIDRHSLIKQESDKFRIYHSYPDRRLFAQPGDRSEVATDSIFTSFEEAEVACFLENFEDPDGIGKDANLFNTDYAEDGEAGLAVANKVANMTGLDRIIFEDGHNGSGKTQRQSMNVPRPSNIQNPDWISSQLGCSLDQAIDLLDYLNIIDDSGKTHYEIIRRIIEGDSFDNDLAYYEMLAEELTDDDLHEVDEEAIDISWASQRLGLSYTFENPATALKYTANLFRHRKDKKTESVIDFINRKRGTGTSNYITDHSFDCYHDELLESYIEAFGVNKDLENLENWGWTIEPGSARLWSEDGLKEHLKTNEVRDDMFRIPDLIEAPEFILDRPTYEYTGTNLFRYQTINNDIGHRHSWIARQSNDYRKLLKDIRTCTDLSWLFVVGKEIGNPITTRRYAKLCRNGNKDEAARFFSKHRLAITMTNPQKKAFWGFYNHRKAQLLAKAEKGTKGFFSTLLGRVKNAPNSKLKFVGFVLYEMSKGIRKTPVKLSNRQWTTIWDEYKSRKQAVTTLPPEPPIECY